MNLRISSGALLALLLSDVSSVTAFAPSSSCVSSSSMTASASPSQKHGSSRTSQLNVASSLPLNGFQPNTNNGLEVVDSNVQNDSKVGVLLLNLGGPEKTEDVEGASANGCQWLMSAFGVLRDYCTNVTAFQQTKMNLTQPLRYSSLPIPNFDYACMGIFSVSLWYWIFNRPESKNFGEIQVSYIICLLILILSDYQHYYHRCRRRLLCSYRNAVLPKVERHTKASAVDRRS